MAQREKVVPGHPAVLGTQNVSWRVAHWISQVGMPPVLSFLAILLSVAPTGRWHWLAAYAALTVLLPAAFVLYLFRRGLVTDLHMRRRAERILPTTFHTGCMLLITTFLFLAPGAPAVLRFLALLQTVQTTVFLTITLNWKISAHAGNAALVATLGPLLHGPSLLPLLLMVPLIAWSRVRLGRHTVAQTVAGAALGSASTVAVYIWNGVL